MMEFAFKKLKTQSDLFVPEEYGNIPTLEKLSSSTRFQKYRETNENFAINIIIELDKLVYEESDLIYPPPNR